MKFFPGSKDNIPHELDIMNSHPEFYTIATGKPILSQEDIIRTI